MATRTTTFTFTPAPVLRITLTQPQKELWKRMADKCNGLSPDAALQILRSERKKILDDAELRGLGYVTENEANGLNWATKKTMEIITDVFKKNALELLSLDPSDPPEKSKAKIELAKELMTWLMDLIKWLATQMGALDLDTDVGGPNPDPTPTGDDKTQAAAILKQPSLSDESNPLDNEKELDIKKDAALHNLKRIWVNMAAAFDKPLQA